MENDLIEEGAVAIVGLSCRVPKARNKEEFWANLCEGKESITYFSSDELDSSVPASLKNDPDYVAARGVLEDADKFDAAFFGMSPREAEMTDPQQRVFLECAWSALEDAGYVGSEYEGLVGVYAGMGNNTYYPHNLASNPDRIEMFGHLQTMIANEKDYLTTRAAYKLGLTGPCLNIYTACSTSLVAVCEGFQSLLSFQTDVALAGGVSIVSPQLSGYLYNEGSILSRDGYCRPFDAAAEGTLFGSGVGIVVMKRLDEALADRDHIYAVIRGVGMNNDGADRVSFSAPSVDGQARVIAMAHASAGVDADTVTYVEAHGTATPIGDPIEVEALTQAFSQQTDKKNYCGLGSVKGNLGHLDAAAGVIGLIKTTLALKHGVIPKSLHFERPNPAIDFANSPFYVTAELQDWPKTKHPRRAGVSSFGTGGTNAHVVLEEPPVIGHPQTNQRPCQLLTLSAASEASLAAISADLAEFFSHSPNCSLADAAYTLAVGRRDFPYRRVIAADSFDVAAKELIKPASKDLQTHRTATDTPSIVFVFPGQGVQHVNMGRAIYAAEAVYRQSVDDCAAILQREMGRDIREVLFPAVGTEDEAKGQLNQTAVTQPAIFTTSYAIARLWQSWGITPEAVMGHSIGEFVAACIAGVISLEDALKMVAARGRLMQDLPPGSMLSVRCAVEDIEQYLTEDVSIAAVNGPMLCVVSGSKEAISSLQNQLGQADVPCQLLFTSHAFHSKMMEPMLDAFREVCSHVTFNKPEIPVVSTVSGDWIGSTEYTSADYWVKQVRSSVNFKAAISTVLQDDNRILLETGPRNTATSMARQQLSGKAIQRAFPSFSNADEQENQWPDLMHAAGKLWMSGAEIDWNVFFRGSERCRVSLPAYNFSKDRHWVDCATIPALTVTLQGGINQESNNSTAKIAAEALMETPTDRKSHLIELIIDELENVSGESVGTDDSDTSFVELGFDSLCLTQASLSLKKKFGTNIGLRDLMERYPTAVKLAEHLDDELPADKFAPPAAAPAGPSANGSTHLITSLPSQDNPEQFAQYIIAEQLNIMKQQLAALNQQNVNLSDNHLHNLQHQVQNKAEKNLNKKSDSDSSNKQTTFGPSVKINTQKTVAASAALDEKANAIIKRIINCTALSKKFTETNRPQLADPRVVSGFSPLLKEITYPVVVERSAGSRLWDIDGNEYIDVTSGFGSNLLGHRPPDIIAALKVQLDQGIEIGPQHPLTEQVAALMREFTGHDRVAFCNTGSEAVLGAIRIARTTTARDKIVIFADSYHGIFDEVIVRGGNHKPSKPAAPGIPASATENILVLEYGSAESLDIIRQQADDIAAVLTEPVQSRHLSLQPHEFLHQLRVLTEEQGILLIFDEVITGFRVHPGGAQAYFDVKADVATYGKVIGGGLPFAAIAGKSRYMDALDGGHWRYGDESFPEVGVTYFAGTFVRHPLALAACRAILLHLKDAGADLQQQLNEKTRKLVERFQQSIEKHQAPIEIDYFSSMFQLRFLQESPYTGLFYALLREHGLYIAEGRVWFLTVAHSDADLDSIVHAFDSALAEIVSGGFLGDTDQQIQAPMKTNLTQQHGGNGRGETPPVPGARLGRDPSGTSAWFVPDSNRPGKYLQLK